MTDGCWDNDWERYCEEFDVLASQISSDTTTTDRTLLLQQCEELLQQMTLEARSVSDNCELKNRMLEKVKVYKGTLRCLQKMESSLSDRNELLLGGKLQQQQPLQRQANDETTTVTGLDGALRSMHETEDTALEIMDVLAQNRATLASAQHHIHETQTMTERAQQIMKQMSRPWRGFGK